MNYLIKLLMAMTLAIAGSHAQAIPIVPEDCGQEGCMTGINTGISEIDSYVKSMLGVEELYTSSVGSNPDSGLFADSYTTTFDNLPASPSDALIARVDGQQGISCLECYLLVMDNDVDPAAWYLFNLGAWDWDSISLTGFWPDAGAISYVAIYGRQGTSVVQSASVAAPAPLVLLTIGLLLSGLRRLKAS
jgi:hypothetical protein